MTSSFRRLLCTTFFLAVALVPYRAWAVTDTYCSFSASLTTFTLNQNAFFSGTKIRLTDAVANEIGSAYLTAPIPITAATSVSAYFSIELGPSATGGDGLAFVMQNAAAGATAIGAGADDLGYATTVTPSVVVKFDTSSGAQATNYVGLMLNGSTTVTAQATMPIAGAGMLYVWVDYNSGTQVIAIYVSTTTTKPGTANVIHALDLFTQLGSPAHMYVGFSAATGATAAASNLQDVYALELSTDGVPCTCEGDSACSGATPGVRRVRHLRDLLRHELLRVHGGDARVQRPGQHVRRLPDEHRLHGSGRAHLQLG